MVVRQGVRTQYSADRDEEPDVSTGLLTETRRAMKRAIVRERTTAAAKGIWMCSHGLSVGSEGTWGSCVVLMA